MSSKTKALLVLLIAFFACTSQEQKVHPEEGTTIANKIETFDPVIEVKSSRTSFGESGLDIIDCRKLKDHEKAVYPIPLVSSVMTSRTKITTIRA